jgi:uncharacterized protein (TIGR02271 family)
MVMVVVDKNGLRGKVAQVRPSTADSKNPVLVDFENGQQVMVPSDLLVRHDNGLYHLSLSVAELVANQHTHEVSGKDINDQGMGDHHGDHHVVIPVVEEHLTVHTEVRESGIVEIQKRIHERTETVDVPLHSEEVAIERVSVNRFVTEPVEVRHEGETMIIPLLEEVLVVEKRLLLREEVHVTRKKSVVNNPQEVQLRSEEVEIVRKPAATRGTEENAGA